MWSSNNNTLFEFLYMRLTRKDIQWCCLNKCKLTYIIEKGIFNYYMNIQIKDCILNKSGELQDNNQVTIQTFLIERGCKPKIQHFT